MAFAVQETSDRLQFQGVISNIGSLIAVLCTINMFHNMLLHDSRMKKIIFGITIIILYWKSQVNPLCAKTTALLLKITILQIWVMGLFVKYRSRLNFISKQTKQQNKSFEWQNVFVIVLVTQVFSTISILVLILFGSQYQSPLSFSEVSFVAPLFVFIFVGVAIFDKLFFKGFKNSTRRKTFHFVPVIVAPILIIINYKLALLLAVLAFFVFWQMQTLRYYAKLARSQILKNKEESKQNISLNIQIQKGSDKTLFLINQLVHTLEKFKLFVWMQELNSAREPHFYFTHLSLMLGLTLTFIFYPCSSSQCNYTSSKDIAILSRQNMSIFLTLADAAAAIIGSRYGRHRISKSNKKTFQGYFAFVITLITLKIALYLPLGDFKDFQPILTLISAICCGFGQLFSGDMDNIATGLVYVAVTYVYDSLT